MLFSTRLNALLEPGRLPGNLAEQIRQRGKRLMAEPPRSPTVDPLSRARQCEGRRQASAYKAYMKDQVMYLLFRDQPKDTFPMVAALGELVTEVGVSLISTEVTVSLLRQLANQLEQGGGEPVGGPA
jgi:hypothetical protein